MMAAALPLGPIRLRALRRSRRGFSLVEMLVVVAILAIIFIIGGEQITKAWKRQKTQSAATDIKVLFQRAYPEMQRRNMQTFIEIGPLTVAGGAKYVPIYLIGDADQDGGVGAFCRDVGCPDLLIDEYDIVVVGKTGVMGTSGVDQEFSLSDLAVNQVASTFWSDNNPSWTKTRAIMCDFRGRAIAMTAGATPPPDPVSTGAPIGGPATLVLTHVDVVNGSLMPATRYVISINPVWSVRVAKQTNATPSNPATWVTQNG